MSFTFADPVARVQAGEFFVVKSEKEGDSTPRKSLMGLVRKAKHRVRDSGFVVTWDVNGQNHATANRLWAFLFTRTVRVDDREYRYAGFLWKDGVRYMA